MQKIEFKVGLFITITALLLAGSVGYVAYKKGLFAKVYTYTILSRTGEDLAEGMPVFFWGFTIGRVSSLELKEKGVIIKIKIPERHNWMIRQNSRFILEKPLIGSPRLVVSTDNLDSPPLSPNTIPELGVSKDINELIKRVQPIAEKVDDIAASVSTVMSNLADPQGDVNRILRNAEVMTARFATRNSLLEMALADPESVRAVHESLQKVRDIAVHADDVVRKIDGIAAKADEGLYGPEGVLVEVRAILRDTLKKLAKIDVTLENVNKISGEAAEASKDLKVLRAEVDAAISALTNLADEIDRKIPFKKEPEITLP